MTEMNSVVVSFGGIYSSLSSKSAHGSYIRVGDDYLARPTSTGLPCSINDVVIVQNGQVAKPGEVGELWV
jgi:hypothetical protein